MTDSAPHSASSRRPKRIPFGELITVASALGAGGLISARVAGGEFGDVPGMLAFSWSGALVSVGAALGLCGTLLKRGPSSGQRGLVQVFGVATIGVAWALGFGVLPGVPRAFGGTSPTCQVLTLTRKFMAPHLIEALKGGAQRGEVIVTAPVQVFASEPKGLHFLAKSGRLMRINHQAIVSRVACAASRP